MVCYGISGVVIFCVVFIRNFRNKKGIGAERSATIVSGIITSDAPISYWPILFPCS